MDGFAATQRIREVLEIGARELPILALTASALVEQRERAAALGMEDFVMKPFEPADLKRRIAGAVWRVRQGRRGTPVPGDAAGGDVAAASTPGEAPPPAAEPVDLAILEAQTLGQPDFVVEMIDVFQAHAPAQCEDILRSVAARDRAALQAAAHKLKSAAAVMGAVPLMHLLEALENDAGEAPFVQLTAAARATDGEVGRVRGRLASLRATYTGEAS
jgi:CheY-like chemotaxis protein